MSDTTTLSDNYAIEKRALTVGKWTNLFMGVAGVTAAWLSRSDAMLVDGLYSGINFFSAVVAARVTARINRPPDRTRPWGYDFDETIYITFRSLLLVGILVFAAFVSGSKIATYASGGEVPKLVFGPIAIYAVTMVLTCAGLAYSFHRAYKRTGKTSPILKTEARAAVVDGALSAGSGVALLSLPFLSNTPLAPFTPVGDAIVVVMLVLIIIWQPIGIFRSAIGQLSGISAPAKTVSAVAKTARDYSNEHGFRFLRSATQKAGRNHFVVVYVNPGRQITAAEIDVFWKGLGARLEDRIGPVRMEVVVTEIGDIDVSFEAVDGNQPKADP
ncbi:MAG: cation transporter [Roseibium sp.]